MNLALSMRKEAIDMNVSVCTIVKNEATRIQEYINNVQKYADEILFVDNGSSDDTVEIIKRNNCRVLFSTDSFDLARNAYLGKAKQDWILNLDIDEQLEEGYIDYLFWKLSKMDKAVQGVILPIFNYFGGGYWSQWNYPRLIRNNHNQKLTSPIHASFSQSIVDSGGILGYVYGPIHHFDALINSNQLVKRKRNLDFLNKAIKSNPEQSGIFLNLANEYYALGRKEEAIEIVKEGLIRDKTSNSRIYKGLANYCYDMGKYEESIEYAKKQIEKFKKLIRKRDARTSRYELEIEACRVIIYKNYYALGEKEKAIMICNENIKYYPMLPHNYLNRFIISNGKRKSDYEMAVLLNPKMRNREIYSDIKENNLYKFCSSIIMENSGLIENYREELW